SPPLACRRPRHRSCPAAPRSPICNGRMTNPAPGRPSPVPSISRLFAAAFLAIAVAGLADRVATWRSARRTQADMIELSQRLEQLARVSPSPALQPQLVAMRELAAEVGDNAIQAAVQTTVIFVIVLVALGVGLWYNRGRLATPFAHVVGALQRVAAGRYDERRGGARADTTAIRHRGRRFRLGARARAPALPRSARRPARRDGGRGALLRRARRARARGAEPGHCLRARLRAPAHPPPSGGG